MHTLWLPCRGAVIGGVCFALEGHVGNAELAIRIGEGSGISLAAIALSHAQHRVGAHERLGPRQTGGLAPADRAD